MEGSAPQEWIGIANAASTALNESGQEALDAVRRQFLVVHLDDSDYAIEVERVREIVRMRELTRVPRTPDWLLGVIALRGEVVEVVDLSARLGLPRTPPDRSSRIIVLHGEEDRVTGVLVDAVREVFRVADDEILPAGDLDLVAISEMCRRDGGFVSVIDFDRVFEFDYE